MDADRIESFAFTLERHAVEHGVALKLRGELDLSVALEARRLAETELERGNDLEIDLSGLEFVDSTGLQALFQVKGQAETLGRTVTIHGPLQSQVRRVLRFSGLIRLLGAED